MDFTYAFQSKKGQATTFMFYLFKIKELHSVNLFSSTALLVLNIIRYYFYNKLNLTNLIVDNKLKLISRGAVMHSFLPPLAGWPSQTSFIHEPISRPHKVMSRKRKSHRSAAKHHRKKG